MNYLSGNIKLLRQQKGMDINGFAASLDLAVEMALRIEDERQEPGMDLLIKISDTLKVSIDRLLKMDLAAIIRHSREKDIKLLVLDVDGVLTDGGMYYTEGGDEFKKFNTKDGMAIKQLVKNGMVIGIISSGYNAALINRRAELLGIRHVYTGPESKLNIIKTWCDKYNYDLKQIAYIGDDINDLEIMSAVGLTACPADAIQRVRDIADIVLERNGGAGCVREFVDNYLLEM